MIYFIRNTSGAIKIGFTSKNNVKSRLSQLQTASPGKLSVLGTIKKGQKEDESAIHHQFREFRIRGEWYYSDKSIFDYIRDNCDSNKTIPAKIQATYDKRKVKKQAKTTANIHAHKSRKKIKGVTVYRDSKNYSLKKAIDERVKKLVKKHESKKSKKLTTVYHR